MTNNTLKKAIGFFVFIITLLVYFSTVQPSVSFWDCGEFIASSYAMQVPHPPGTPFFLMIGRLLSLIPFTGNIGLRVNTISVLSSAFTALFLYLIAIKLIENFRSKEYKNIIDALGTYVAAAVGAFSLAFSDTFWFNGVEAEVYAFSTFFIAFVVWLMVVWNEKADEPGSEKYLIFIAYLIGLATGVHLMAVLAIVPVVMVVVFRKYVSDEAVLKSTGMIFIVHSALILMIAAIMWSSYKDTAPPAYEEFGAVDSRFVMILGVVSIIFMAALWKKIFNRNSFYIPLIIGGIALIAVYPGMVKYLAKMITGIGNNNTTEDVIIFLLFFVILGAGIYWSSRNEKPTLNLILKSALFAILGVTTYASIIIRSNQETPINMNSPKTFTELESYLNREQYGDFPIFKRRFSNESNQQAIYKNYSSDLDFLWRYQINHMFNRYLFWNYIGRISTNEDAGVDWTKLFGIPFMIGLFGLYYHFRRDWKMASVFLVMFIFLGYLTAFYQNQQQPQPRERDYFYVGAFFVYSIWIALGIRGLIDLTEEYIADQKHVNIAAVSVIVLGVLLVPVNMLKANYFEHNRSRNYVPWDYAYNMLQSVAPNAIVFTNGDNDTFPLWYLQDVEGVRRDVRIANLSLLNTGWYIKQLKNTEPYGTPGIKMSFTNEEIDQLSLTRWEPQTMAIDVPDSIIAKYSITDTSVVNNKKLSWTMPNSTVINGVKAIRAQDIVVLDIVMNSKWERPVYFAVTCSGDSQIGLDDYLQMEGMALRITPKKFEHSMENVNEPVLSKQLFDQPDGFSKSYKPGFKFRGLNDSTIFFDENHVRLTQNYRNAYIRLALYYLNQQKDNNKAVHALDVMEKNLPRKIIDMDYRIKHDVAKIYNLAGAKGKYEEFAHEVIASALQRIKDNPRDFSSWYNPYDLLLTHYENLGEYRNAVELLMKLQQYVPGDDNVKNLIQHYRKLAGMDSLEIESKKIEQK